MPADKSGAAARLQLSGPQATDRFGTSLAQSLGAGHMLLLRGDLGAGKTSLARALIRALMNAPALEVPSPSFALVQPYEGPDFPILHADLYRLADEGELEELGLFDDPEALLIVEWPERAPHLLDEADLLADLDLANEGAARQAVLSSPKGTLDVAVLAAGFAGSS